MVPRFIWFVGLGVTWCLGCCAFLYIWLADEQTTGPTAHGGKGKSVLFMWVSDCSPYQDWQSLLLIWSLYRYHGPRSVVVRLISGCTALEEEVQRAKHASLFPGGTSDSGPPQLVFTPAHTHDEALNDTYPPYNRPFSILQWVSRRDISVADDTWVVILDPDMLMLAPLELPSYVSSHDDLIYRGSLPVNSAQQFQAFGQRYHYLAKRWGDAALQLDSICEPWAHDCLKLTGSEVAEFFSVGPPWIVRFSDLKRAAPLWQAYTPRIRKQYTQLIAEMYAYSLAFASIGVRHALFDHFVVSYPNAPADEQAWLWIDDERIMNPCAADGLDTGGRRPTFLHYCEIYSIEAWYFQKRRVPHSDVLSCSAPLFALPPEHLLQNRRDAADGSTYGVTAIRQAWFLCTLLSVINDGAASLRAGLCPQGFNQTLALRVPFPEDSFSRALQEFFKS